jgi:hypothetical protein
MENLIKSREFWVMLITLVVNVIVALVPQLAESKDIIIGSLTALALVIVGFIGSEKNAAAKASGSTKIERMSK